MRETFKTLITDFQERKLDNIISREYDIPVGSEKIVSLVGVRRCGKTSILFDIINSLKKKVPSENIIYVNFEDDRLFPTELGDLNHIMEGYYEMRPEKRHETVYVFLDEVQNIAGWERYVRRIYDTLNIRVFVTGSSSKLLSKEIATSLRGRTLTYEIFPYSFADFLKAKGIKVNFNSSDSVSYIKNALSEYLTDGGFPETVLQSADIKRRILRDYLDLIVYKDIVERYGIKNNSLLKHIIKYSFCNIGTLVSLNKLYNDLKSQGYKLSKDTVFDYYSYLEDAYAVFSIPVFRNSIKEENRNPRKIYSVDNGFKGVYDAFVTDDFSKLYENAVFLHLRRQTPEIYYYSGKQEVDFYCVAEGKKVLVNVSYKIDSPKTRERELNGLLEAMEYFKMSEAYLITADEEETFQQDDRTIHILPLWKWLLG
ncbi:ATP-binding protein [Geovibrio thiophilus]|uniref:ATP-binding protein n=1 Tax=Geovibrio thiophilus TaxID=139438 RepID=A0A410JW12_9BACT|nr:ATP-binding protein [Geovibrio thiophilus]QAR32410.1 ATP-binding protein [Geovibrio thiophilus]